MISNSCELSTTVQKHAMPTESCGTMSPNAAGDVVTVVMRTDSITRALSLICRHHSMKANLVSQMNDQVHQYLDSAIDEKVWLKRAKCLLTTPMSDYLRNERPPRPDCGYFEPSGALRRWWRNRIFVFNRKNTHLWYSWLQAKRAALPLSDDLVESTYGDHYTSLSRTDPGDTSIINRIFDNYDFCQVLERIRDSVFRRYVPGSYDCRTSTSACFERKRSEGGQVDQLRSIIGMDAAIWDEVDGLHEGEKTVMSTLRNVHLPTDELVSMSWKPQVFERFQAPRSRVLEKRRHADTDLWESELKSKTLDFLRETGQEPINCTIQAVLEPFKVRVISKGEALPYYNCKPLQEILREELSRLPCFRLLSRPMCATDLVDLGRRVGYNDEWFSVDYSAATDGLSWSYSGRILEFLIQDLPEVDRMLAMKVLGPHRLSYPTRTGQAFYKGMQRNGQLMGSILSFPILCLANLGVYLLVNAERQKSWDLDSILNHVLVNGDDMVYAAPSELWEEHIKVARSVGLEMSVGKAYHHKTYVNINSTSFHYEIPKVFNMELSTHKYSTGPNPRIGSTTPWQIDFLNTGLYFGSRKVQSKDKKELCEDFSAYYAKAHVSADPSKGFAININTILQGCLPGKQCSILKQYLALHAAEIDAECLSHGDFDSDISIINPFGYFRRNLFLPISLGGMGQKAPIGFRYRITTAQRKLRSYLLDRYKSTGLDLNFDLPMTGYPVEEFDELIKAPYAKVKSEKEPLVVKEKMNKSYKRGSLIKVGVFLSGKNQSCCIL